MSGCVLVVCVWVCASGVGGQVLVVRVWVCASGVGGQVLVVWVGITSAMVRGMDPGASGHCVAVLSQQCAYLMQHPTVSSYH